jgi:hypothetical protein
LRSGRWALVTSQDAPELPADVDVLAPAKPTSASLLVRPDGYVAWAGETWSGLDAAQARWLVWATSSRS